MTSLSTRIALLRGVNVGSANRIAMPALRDALTAAGFVRVRTHGQSGNVVADGDPDALIAELRGIIDVPCVLRSVTAFDAAIAANPFAAQAAEDPPRLQVTFRGLPAQPGLEAALSAQARGGERVAVNGAEIYSWHPDGIAGSRLAEAVVPRGEAASSRNWNTVLAIAALAHA
ncbi:DUF1697 domain-containing protein [Conexibacter sp. DBS9H8]|uniref:DUF1697 domain-containing protein n=1 Tax=Conexibacter sp. DBS9H8 TaxID=2937801 RepID=UPI00200D30F9|nr:DUF1697 domain-containing protein [Conexibacter sp. DBS9H8]